MVHVISSLRPVASPVINPPRARQAVANAATDATTNTTTPSTSTTPAVNPFLALFASQITAPAEPAPAPTPPAPTAESVFGANPWMSNPTGVGPTGSYSFNPYYFATAQTAAKVAQMVGGTVVQSNQFTPNGGPFQQQQANYMVQLPNGRTINPGLVASFYTHGYPQSYVDMMVACEVGNA